MMITSISKVFLRLTIGSHNILAKNPTPLVSQIKPELPFQVRWFRDRYLLKLRCKDCYFKKIDDRWWVLCKSKGRHKQREKIDDIRNKWIVSHVTRGGSNKYFPWYKNHQYPGHDL